MTKSQTLYRFSFENYPTKFAWGKNEEEARHAFQWTFGFWPKGNLEIVDEVAACASTERR